MSELNNALNRSADNARLYSEERAKNQRLQFELDERTEELARLTKYVKQLEEQAGRDAVKKSLFAELNDEMTKIRARKAQ